MSFLSRRKRNYFQQIKKPTTFVAGFPFAEKEAPTPFSLCQCFQGIPSATIQ